MTDKLTTKTNYIVPADFTIPDENKQDAGAVRVEHVQDYVDNLYYEYLRDFNGDNCGIDDVVNNNCSDEEEKQLSDIFIVASKIHHTLIKTEHVDWDMNKLIYYNDDDCKKFQFQTKIIITKNTARIFNNSKDDIVTIIGTFKSKDASLELINSFLLKTNNE